MPFPQDFGRREPELVHGGGSGDGVDRRRRRRRRRAAGAQGVGDADLGRVRGCVLERRPAFRERRARRPCRPRTLDPCRLEPCGRERLVAAEVHSDVSDDLVPRRRVAVGGGEHRRRLDRQLAVDLQDGVQPLHHVVRHARMGDRQLGRQLREPLDRKRRRRERLQATERAEVNLAVGDRRQRNQLRHIVAQLHYQRPSLTLNRGSPRGRARVGVLARADARQLSQLVLEPRERRQLAP